MFLFKPFGLSTALTPRTSGGHTLFCHWPTSVCNLDAGTAYYRMNAAGQDVARFFIHVSKILETPPLRERSSLTIEDRARGIASMEGGRAAS